MGVVKNVRSDVNNCCRCGKEVGVVLMLNCGLEAYFS